MNKANRLMNMVRNDREMLALFFCIILSGAAVVCAAVTYLYL
jgi:hypothetical protein